MKSRTRNRSSLTGKVMVGLSALGLVAAISTLVIGWKLFRDEFPDVTQLKSQYPVVRYEGRDKPFTMRWEKGRPAHWVGLSEVSRSAVGAIIVSEDWAFYSHQGYDANQIREAIKEDWEQGTFARGASTITQQVVKNVFLERDKNLWRKIKELYLAVQIEKTVGKKRILETYLNIAEWGEGIFGIRAAANHYFGKHPSELTAKEGAFLAMLLPSPKRYSQSFRARQLTPYARRIVRSILDKMERAQYLTAEERIIEASQPLSWETSPSIEEPPSRGDEDTPLPPDDSIEDLTPEERDV